MQALRVQNDGSLAWAEENSPEVGSDSVRMTIKAAGVNRADLLQAQGHYPPPEGSSTIIGLEAAGTIKTVGREVHDWEAGQNAMALLPGGGYATEVVVPASMLLPIPAEWSFTEAAAIPEALYTSYFNLCYLGQLSQGETVLIHAGAGGIGSMAVQLAKQRGADVIATVGSDAKADFVKRLGADTALNYKLHDLKAGILKSAPEGVDVILDAIAGEAYTNLHPKVLKRYGQWFLIGLLGGTKATLNMGLILAKNLLLKGSTLRYQPPELKVHLTQLIKSELLPYLNTRTIQPCVDQVYPMSRVEEAHAYLRANQTKGKVILTP